MNPHRQRQLAAAFSQLHRGERIIVLPNAFDCASARLIAAHGPVALGTSSGAIAWGAGYPDGEQMPRSELLEATRRVIEAVDIGVSADMEAGYGSSPEEAAATAAMLIGIGAIGVNLEDSRHDEGHAGELVALPHAVDKVAAVRLVAQEERVELVLNARTDVFLTASGSTDDLVAEATERGNAYLAAGADCVFVPGAVDRDVIKALVGSIRGPISLYALPGLPSPGELERLGVRRVSVGSGPYQACLALVDDATRSLLKQEGGGSYEPFLSHHLPFPAVQELLAAPPPGSPT